MKKNVELTLEQARELHKKGDELTNSILLNSFTKKELEIITYETISEELFTTNNVYWANIYGAISCVEDGICSQQENSNNCISEEQVKQMLELNKLRNVAYYLNGNKFIKEGFYLNVTTNGGLTFGHTNVPNSAPLFKDVYLGSEAVKILGKQSVLTALGYYLI